MHVKSAMAERGIVVGYILRNMISLRAKLLDHPPCMCTGPQQFVSTPVPITTSEEESQEC